MKTYNPKQASNKEEIQKPTPQERRVKVIEILKKHKGNILQKEIVYELEKFFKCEIGQTDVSKDFKELGIVKKKDGTGYEIAESRKYNSDRLKKIAKDCYFISSDVYTDEDFKTLIIKSQNIAHSHMLGSHLQVMYSDIIIDIICSENSVVVYYINNPVLKGKSLTLEDDIKVHFPDLPH